MPEIDKKALEEAVKERMAAMLDREPTVALSQGERYILEKAGIPYAGYCMEGRPESAVGRDERFLEAWVLANGVAKDTKFVAEYVIHRGGLLSILLDDEHGVKQMKLPRGVYERENLIVSFKHNKKPARISLPSEGWRFAFIPTARNAGQHHHRTVVGFLFGAGLVRFWLNPYKVRDWSYKTAYPGFIYSLYNNGLLRFKGPMTSEEFTESYPVCGVGYNGGYYHTRLFSRDLAPMWDRAPQVLKEWQKQLKLFPSAKLVSVVPSWVRSYGWAYDSGGNLNRQHGMMYKVSMPYQTQTLCRDEVGWRVHLTLDGTEIPGVAFFNEEGNLIISDWCFREDPNGRGIKEMYHGKTNKLGLLEWVAGPCADKFGAREKHGFRTITKISTQDSNAERKALLTKLLDLGTTVNTFDELASVMAAKGDKVEGGLYRPLQGYYAAAILPDGLAPYINIYDAKMFSAAVKGQIHIETGERYLSKDIAYFHFPGVFLPASVSTALGLPSAKKVEFVENSSPDEAEEDFSD